MKLLCSQQIFEKYSNIKFHENPSSGSRVVSCGQTDGRTDGQTDMTKLIVALRNFANAPKDSVPSFVKHHLSWLVLLSVDCEQRAEFVSALKQVVHVAFDRCSEGCVFSLELYLT